MKSLYLILAAAAVVVTSKPQRSNNDIIWYPVEDEEGVFISTYGEKHRSSPQAKWRSHRRARYSGVALPLSFDPTENQDPSFFHNINERRPSLSTITNQKPPSFFQDSQFIFDGPNSKPQGQKNENFNENTFQEILNEVFDYNKYPPATEPSGSKPGTTNRWGIRPTTELQNPWGGNLVTGNTFQWGNGMQRPVVQRPGDQWSGTSSRPSERPTNNEWITQGSRPMGSNKPNKTNQSDKLVFPEDVSSPTTPSSNMNPTERPTMSPCERLCPVTPEFNPVCGSDSITYSNAGRLKCAQKCGKNVELAHHGNCGRTSLVTPLVSSSRKQKFRGFWFIDK